MEPTAPIGVEHRVVLRGGLLREALCPETRELGGGLVFMKLNQSCRPLAQLLGRRTRGSTATLWWLGYKSMQVWVATCAPCMV
jgi:hypothetical protein